MLIDGELVDSVDGERFVTSNPATGEEIGTIPRGTSSDVDRAIAAADRAFEDWYWKLDPVERADSLVEFANVVREHSDKLGALDAADSGNPYGEMRNDAGNAAATVEMFSGLAREIKGDTIPLSNDTLDYTLEQPYGVVGQILAYNHPVLFAVSKIAAPLIAGNTVVIKPPEQDSLGVMELGRLINDADVFPDGVVNIVSGFGDEVGSTLVTHKDVSKVGFTGSVDTGSIIQQQAAETITDVHLELGGKNPGIIYPDADLEKSIRGIVDGMNLTWCGQSCGSISRLFLHESQYEEGLQLLQNIFTRIEPGDPLDPETEMGCLVSRDQLEKVLHYFEIAKESDLRLLAGGKQPDDVEYENGCFVEPTLFADATMDMRIAREETFGPLLLVFKWTDEEQVIDMANDVKYGLTASIWTENLEKAHRTAERLEAGYVWVNQAGRHHLGAPFGGWKQSGTGREEAIDEIFGYTQTKNVNIQL
jgi:betaine-aldehyde dehydrogenase